MSSGIFFGQPPKMGFSKLLVGRMWFYAIVRHFLPQLLEEGDPPSIDNQNLMRRVGSTAYHDLEDMYVGKDHRFLAVVILMRLIFPKAFLDIGFADITHQEYLYGLLHQLLEREPDLKNELNTDCQVQSGLRVNFMESYVKKQFWVFPNFFFKFVLRALGKYHLYSEEPIQTDFVTKAIIHRGKKICVQFFLKSLVRMSEDVMKEHGLNNWKFPIDVWK